MTTTEWVETSKGNQVYRHDDGEILATVFRNKVGIWQIIINKDKFGRLVADEYYEDIDNAIERTEAIVDGAPCQLLPPRF